MSSPPISPTTLASYLLLTPTPTTPQILTFDLTPTILTDGQHINIPKPTIYSAFASLRTELSNPAASSPSFPPPSPYHLDPANTSSLITLLATPPDLGPLTIWRWRILNFLPDPVRNAFLPASHRPNPHNAAQKRQPRGDWKLELKKELNLLATLLGSRDRKLNKAPGVWEYRRWVLRVLHYQHGGGGAVKLGMEDVEKELDLILISAEFHSGNYYAWNHARWAWSHYSPNSISPPPTERLKENFKERVWERVYAFACSHPSDCSAWSFLTYQFSLPRGAEGGVSALPHPLALDSKKKLGILEEAMHYAAHIAMGHEAIWAFVKVALVKGFDDEGEEGEWVRGERERLWGILKEWVEVGQGRRKEGGMMEGGEDERELMCQEGVLGWVRKFGGFD